MKSMMATKSGENLYEDPFVLFVFFVVKLILGSDRRLRCTTDVQILEILSRSSCNYVFSLRSQRSLR